MPRNLINVENASVSYGTKLLLDGVSLGLAEGDRVGVVGRNGGGKTTLLDTLRTVGPRGDGRVSHVGGLALAALPQHPVLPVGATVRDVVVGDAATHTWAGDARVREVLTGLGMAELGLDTVLDPLSGGERRRVALAALLIRDLDLLILDEPTNHLDIEGVDWLANHLTSAQARIKALVTVTHDRWFLDAVCTRMWEVADATVHAFTGGYAAYVLARAERERISATTEARRSNLLRKELAWLRRGPPARTSKPQFRIDAANALIEAEPAARDTLELQRFATARLGKQVYDLTGVSLTLGARPLLRGLDWQIGPGDRIGIVGVNGSGKTSLLRLLIGEIEPTAGRVVRGKTVRPAYLSQEVAVVDPALRVREAVEQVARVIELGNGREMTASSLLDRFGFAGSAQFTRVGELSGGERRRLQLLRLLMDSPNVLVLDEPTNDLDVEVLAVVEDLLDSWPGTLVLVSHDRYFLERVTDTVFALPGDATLRHLPGGVEQFLAERPGRTPIRPPPSAPSGASPAADQRAARKELARVERRLEAISRREEKVHAQMAERAADHEAVLALDVELRELAPEKSALEDRWLELFE